MPDVIINTPTIAGREHWLAQNIASVEAQTVAPLEHRIRQDTAALGPWRMHNDLAAEGIDAAGGPRPDLWVLNLDDDNALEPRYLELMGALADSVADDVAVVWSWPHLVIDPGAGTGRINYNLDVDGLDIDRLRAANYIDLCALVRSTAWVDAGGLPDDVAYGDWALWLRLIDDGWGLECFPRRLWYYRLHREQIGARFNDLVANGALVPR